VIRKYIGVKNYLKKMDATAWRKLLRIEMPGN
jgi:hypothetical protein